MAEFNPKVSQGNDPSYIGYSRETSGDQSLASLFSGVGSLFGKAVEAYDEDQKEKIQAEVSAGVEENNRDLLSVLGTTEEAENQDDEYFTPKLEEDGLEEGEEFSGDTNAADFNATPDGQAALANARTLTKAMREGKITDTDYWMRMTATAKKLKARYPGYSAIIDRQFQGITGAIPANAYAQAQRKEYNATLTQATQEEKEWRTYVRQNQQYLPPDYYTRIQEGNPYTQLEIQERVRGLKARDYQFKHDENQFNKRTREGNENKENAVGMASNKANIYVDQVLSDSTASFKDLQGMLTKAQQSGVTMTPQEKAIVSQKFNELRMKAEEGVLRLLREPWDDGKTTYYGVINDPSKIKGIVDGALMRIDNMKKYLDDGDFGILNATANYNKAIMQDATRKLLEAHNYYGLVNAAKELGGGDLLNQMFLDTDYRKIQDEAAKSFRDLALMKTVTGDTTSTEETLKKMREDQKAVGVPPGDIRRVARKHIDDKVKVLMSPDAPVESWQGAAVSLYGPKNRNMLSSVTSSQRHDLYMKMTSPLVTQRMVELGKTDPSVFSHYSNWTKKSFTDLFKDLANGVQEGVVYRENIDVGFDPGSSHFTVTTTKQGSARAVERASGNEGLLGGAIKGVEDGLEETSVTAIDKLNREIDNLKPILKAEGKDINEELDKLLHGMGINTEAPKAKTFMQKLRGAILNMINQETPGDGTTKPKPNPKLEKQGAQRTFMEYARAGQEPATAFLTRIRTEGNENVERLNPDFSDRLATMLQEAPAEVRNAVSVDSGYRSEEHQRRLWNAALAKYGSVRKARKWVAPPGHSYHGKGLAVDLKYASPQAREWIRDNAKKYGLHFPLANENWHIELAGSRKPKRKPTRTRIDLSRGQDT